MTSSARSHPIAQSALEAYRADVARASSESTPLDGIAIDVLGLLTQAETAADTADSARRLQSIALSIARGAFTDAEVAIGCSYDDGPAGSDVEIIRLLAERIEVNGRLKVARGLLERAAGFTQDELSRGRLMVDRARNARRQGLMDLAKAQFEHALRHGKRHKLPEIRARAYMGLAGCAQSRGNYAEMRRLLPLGLQASKRAGSLRLEAHALMGLGTTAALAAQYDDAVKHLWRAHQVAVTPAIAHEAGCNLAQVLLLSGRNQEARRLANSLFQFVLPARIALPLLGSFAIASARLGAREDVEWASREVSRLGSQTLYPREVAVALAECGAALAAIGHAQQAEILRQRSEELAISHGFHDLTFAEAIAAASAPAPPSGSLKGGAARAAKAILQLERDHPRSLAVIP